MGSKQWSSFSHFVMRNMVMKDSNGKSERGTYDKREVTHLWETFWDFHDSMERHDKRREASVNGIDLVIGFVIGVFLCMGLSALTNGIAA